MLRDIPGLVIASPSRPDDAGGDAARRAWPRRRPTAASASILEPIALYHTRDLHWRRATTCGLAEPASRSRSGRRGEDATATDDDLTIVTWANGLPMSLRVARRLLERGVDARVVDLRWLAPLPIDDILREATATGRTLVVDETRQHGRRRRRGSSPSSSTRGYRGALARVSSKDSFIPLGDAARLVLVSEAEIEEAAARLLGR